MTNEEARVCYQRYSLAVENLNRALWVEKNLKELAFFIVVYGAKKRVGKERKRHEALWW